MKDTDKVTLTIGQLKRLITESESSENWCVVRFGGSIGDKFTHRVNGKSCVMYKEDLSEDEAKRQAKIYKSFLSPGDKKYYGFTYKAVPRELVKEI